MAIKTKLNTEDHYIGELQVGQNGETLRINKVITKIDGVIKTIYRKIEVPFISDGIYGVEWDGSSSPILTRTDDAIYLPNPNPAVNNGNGTSPFDRIMPWAGMKKVDDAETGTLVEIPKFYYKWTRVDSYMKLQISMTRENGFICSPAHADRGDGYGERDVVYVGRYHCSSGTYKSETSVYPKTRTTRSDFRTNIHALGTSVWQWDLAMLWTIRMLYLVEFANWNSQETIGAGCGNNTSTELSGLTDAMKYHTGTNKPARGTYGHTQYRYIEDLWGNVGDWIDGIYSINTSTYCIKNPSLFSDDSNGTLVGQRAAVTGCIKSWTAPDVVGYEYALVPKEIILDSTFTKYITDQYYYDRQGTIWSVGSSYLQDRHSGIFGNDANRISSYSNAAIGSRLMKL